MKDAVELIEHIYDKLVASTSLNGYVQGLRIMKDEKDKRFLKIVSLEGEAMMNAMQYRALHKMCEWHIRLLILLNILIKITLIMFGDMMVMTLISSYAIYTLYFQFTKAFTLRPEAFMDELQTKSAWHISGSLGVNIFKVVGIIEWVILLVTQWVLGTPDNFLEMILGIIVLAVEILIGCTVGLAILLISIEKSHKLVLSHRRKYIAYKSDSAHVKLLNNEKIVFETDLCVSLANMLILLARVENNEVLLDLYRCNVNKKEGVYWLTDDGSIAYKDTALYDGIHEAVTITSIIIGDTKVDRNNIMKII